MRLIILLAAFGLCLGMKSDESMSHEMKSDESKSDEKLDMSKSDEMKSDESKSEEKYPEPTPEELGRNMINVILMEPVEMDDSEIKMDDVCPCNTPYAGYCERNSDCPKGLMCRDYNMDNDDEDMEKEKYKGKKVCCLANSDLAHEWRCPSTYVPMKNTFCGEDSDCGEYGMCNKEFMLPKDVADDLEEEMGERKTTVGLCCTEKDVIPKVLAHCPTDYLPERRGPCGLGISDECGMGSKCMMANDMFGRCCQHKDNHAKTGQSNHFFYPGFRPFYGPRIYGPRFFGPRIFGPRFYRPYFG